VSRGRAWGPNITQHGTQGPFFECLLNETQHEYKIKLRCVVHPSSMLPVLGSTLSTKKKVKFKQLALS
jgi:hypothetical protein